MSALKQEVHTVTKQEYFKYRKHYEGKYELHDGTIIAMAGGTTSHGRLGGMAYRLIYNLVEANGCEAFNSDISVGIESYGNYYFPDASVVCGEAIVDENENIHNPILIVEVLSPSTALFDRNTKFERYKTLPTLEYYLLIWQDAPRLELFTRPENSAAEEWTVTVIEGLDAELTLPFFTQPLKLTDLYRKVTFEKSDSL